MNGHAGRWFAVALLLLLPRLVTPAEAVTVPTQMPTIQAAVDAIRTGALPDGTVIDVLPGTYGRFAISTTGKSMTIRSTGGPTMTTINAGNTGTAIIVISATGFIRIEGFTVTGGVGQSGNGGGFTFQDASPMVMNMVFQFNSAPAGGGGVLTRSNAVFGNTFIQNNTASQFGGGLLIGGGSRPTFTSCTIVNNVSGTALNFGSGGGVHVNDGSPTFVASTIANNQAPFAGGGIVVIGPFGSPNGESTLTLEDSVVSDNSVSAGLAGIAEGGGIHVEDFTVGVIRRTRITSNSAITGGGLSNFRARYQIESSVVELNQATGGFGGGVEASSNNPTPPLQRAGSIVLTDTVVRNNTAGQGGGVWISGDQLCGGSCPANTSATKATLAITDSVVDGNTASDVAGGIRTSRTTFTLTNSIVSRNAATGTGFGGGVMISDATNATITGARIARNTAAGNGGGIFQDVTVNLALSNSAIHDNTAASSTGGGIFVGSNGNAGTVSQTLFVDNAGTEIVELCPSPSTATRLTYTNNVIVNSGTSIIYDAVCAPGPLNVAQFENNLGNTSGNSGSLALSDVQSKALFMAVPDNSPSVLAWSVVRASSVTINQGVGPFSGANARAATANVTVGANTVYTFNATISTPNGSLTPLTATVLGPPVRFGSVGDIPVPADYDGDGTTDLAVFRPATGEWFIFGSATGFQTRVFGAPASLGLGDVPVPADFDGDGKADLAVYQATIGKWFIFQSTDGYREELFGAPASLGLGHTPVPADFDGDGKADLTVYEAFSGKWFIFGSATGIRTELFGAPASLGLNDTPVPADYDGDGIADLAVFRKATGEWFIFRSTSGPQTMLFGAPASLGLGDIPVPADYDGDGKADLAVRQSMISTWFVFRSSLGFLQQVWGAPTDIAAPGDFDGDGKANIAVWRPGDGSWLILP